MALRISLTSNASRTGVAAPQAYARIASLNYDTAKNEVRVGVSIHLDQAARASNKASIQNATFIGTPGKDMPSLDTIINGVRSVLYTWLKTKPLFGGSVDV